MRPRTAGIASLCLLLLLAGCTSVPAPGTTASPTTDPETTAGTTTTDRNVTGYETLAIDSSGRYPFVEGGIAFEDDPGPEERQYLTVIASADGTDRLNYSAIDEGGAVRTFVEDTDFSTTVLLVFEEYPDSSVPDYRVEEVRRQGTALRVRVNDSSPYGTDDVTVEHLLVRIPWGDEPPERVVVVTEDGREFEWPTGDERLRSPSARNRPVLDRGAVRSAAPFRPG